jgi:hypothetical protein
MSELDKILIDLSNKRRKDVASKNSIPLTNDIKIKKVAFDMYKVLSDHYEGLWKIEEDGEGQKHLIRASAPTSNADKCGDWSATSDYELQNITLAYKHVPIYRFSSDEFGFSSDDIFTFKSALLDRVESDNEFIREVLLDQPEQKVMAIANTFPELKEFTKVE